MVLYFFLIYAYTEALSMFDSFTTTHTNELSDSASTETNSTGRKYCIANWDGASCWMPTLAGTEAVIPCFSSFNGITYDSTRKCYNTKLCIITLLLKFEFLFLILILFSFFCWNVSYVENATRLCLSNGEWAEISNYNRCIPTVRSFEEQMASIEVRIIGHKYKKWHKSSFRVDESGLFVCIS